MFDNLRKHDIVCYKEDSIYVAVMKRGGPDYFVGWELGTTTMDRVCILRDDWDRLQLLGNYEAKLRALATKEDISQLQAALDQLLALFA